MPSVRITKVAKRIAIVVFFTSSMLQAVDVIATEAEQKNNDFDFLLNLEEDWIDDNLQFRLDLSNGGYRGEEWAESFYIHKNEVFDQFDYLSLGFYTDSFDAVNSANFSYTRLFSTRPSWRWHVDFDWQQVDQQPFDRIIILGEKQRQRLFAREEFQSLQDNDRVGIIYVMTVFEEFEESQQGVSLGLDKTIIETEEFLLEWGFGFQWRQVDVDYLLTTKLKAQDILCSAIGGCIEEVAACPNDPSPSFSDIDSADISRDFCLLFSNAQPNDKRINFFLPRVGINLMRVAANREYQASIGWQINVPSLVDMPDDLSALGRPGVDEDFTVLDWRLSWNQCLNCVDSQKTGQSNWQRRLKVATTGQSSLGTILPPQWQGALGGSQTVRGYPESQVAADSLLAVNLEYHWLKLWEEGKGQPLVQKLDCYLFYDLGYFRIEREGTYKFLATQYSLTDTSNSLSSIGFGAEVDFAYDLVLTASVGYALNEIIRLETISTVQDFTLFGPKNLVEEGHTTGHINLSWIF